VQQGELTLAGLGALVAGDADMAAALGDSSGGSRRAMLDAHQRSHLMLQR
jgi:hypothetical protein